jgi:uncharacterized protein YfaS (alpha-2-macroglobulin family)
VRQFEFRRYLPAGKGKPEIEIAPGQESIFEPGTPTRSFTLPRGEAEKSMEVIGIPLKEPGFYVVEIASPRLGAALLERDQPYYAQTSVLVTNLAVHFKHGRESSLAWVTSLDNAEPVPDATVVLRDCRGKEFWRGPTDRNGIARIAKELPAQSALPRCGELGQGFFVSASKADDYSFVWTAWNDSLEPWRFNLAVGGWQGPNVVHAVFDRTLLRAGETVSMKLIARRMTGKGFALVDPSGLSPRAEVRHVASGEKYELDLGWDKRGSADAQWKIPVAAKLGSYEVVVRETARAGREQIAGSFRVEAFRVPTLKATLMPASTPLVRAKEAAFGMQLAYLSGGAAAGSPIKARGLVTPYAASFPEHDGFVFSNGPVKVGRTEPVNDEEATEPDEQDDAPRPVSRDSKVLATQNLVLDAQGGATIRYTGIPDVDSPRQLLAEVEYRDPNGETLSAAKTAVLWPAAMAIGIRSDEWAGTGTELDLRALAVDLNGKPLADVPVEISVFQRRYYTHRKRLIGGFYAYESFSEVKPLAGKDAGSAECRGRTDRLGYLACRIKPDASGEVMVQATAHDAQGNAVAANRELWVAGEDDWWFKADNNDRFDLLPEKKRYEPGNKARFQVRVPFREATVLVSVEREGVLDSFVTRLSGRNPVIELPIKANYAPNVFVSAFVVRGRVTEPAATALVDLGKPSFRLGIAKIDVGWEKNRLGVEVASERSEYRVRESVPVVVRVRTPAGKAPPANTEVTLAAVDEGLLQLKPNDSWKLLDAMMRPRGIEVFTSTAIQEVVGKRHFGKKALVPGGGGGRSTARELFDTLLFWKARVKLDSNGDARVSVPLNDSLSAFRIVAVAEGGSGLFGSGERTIRTNQDLILLSGLPGLVREGDRFGGSFTVRNTTATPQTVAVGARVTADGKPLPELPSQSFELPAESAHTVSWDLRVPLDAGKLIWEVEAKGENVRDSLRATQQVAVALPVQTLQATLLQLEGRQSMPVALPPDAVPGRGGIEVTLEQKLGKDLPGVREWISRYPYTCLEQRVSSAIALRDRKRWDEDMEGLSAQLDRNGLAKYFPSMRDGSEVLTSYLMQVAAAAGWPVPADALVRMKGALKDFVEGRLSRPSELGTADHTFRRVQAMAALAAHGDFEAGWLDSMIVEPNLWPSSAVLDWIALLQSKSASRLAERERWLSEAKNVLRGRTQLSGTTVSLSTDRQDYLWWLMVSGDSNVNRILLQLATEPEWREDAGRLARGALARQQRGHWNTTVANAWGVLAIDRFSREFESAAVTGKVHVALAEQLRTFDWTAAPEGGELRFSWPKGREELALLPSGTGAPWAIVSSRAALPFAQPFTAGLRIARRVDVVEQRVKGEWHRGDVARVTLDLESSSQLTWVVINDPLPPGAQVFGSGLGGDSAMLARDNRTIGSWALWPAFEERRLDSFRVYYRYVPTGKWTVTYSMRLNQDGAFQLPESRVEAMYAPEIFGLVPNAALTVKP